MFDYRELFESWEIAIAMKLVGEYQRKWSCLEQEEFEDLVQECLVRWWRVRDAYDPSRGASKQTYMGVVVRNRLKDLVRAGTADKRKVNCVAASLDEPLGGYESSSTLADELDETDGLCDRRDAVGLGDLRLDLTATMKALTPRQRRICRHLRDGYSVTDLSRLIDAPRSTIYDELKRIRRSFAKRGLKDYLS